MKKLYSIEEHNDIVTINKRASEINSLFNGLLEKEYSESFAVYEFLNLRSIFRSIFINPGIKRQIRKLVEELVKIRVEIAKISLEYETDEFEDEYDYDYDYGRKKRSKRNYKQTRETSPSELKKSTLEDQLQAIEAKMELLAGEDEKMQKFLELQKIQAKLNANELIYKLASDEQQKILNKYNKKVKKDINGLADDLHESLSLNFTHILFEEFYHLTEGKLINENNNINMKYIKTFESFLNEKKEYFIEVSVRDARKALDHLDDMHRRKYKTDGSNYYIFKDEDEAYDVLQHFKDMGIEVEDHNISESLNEGTFEEDEIATYDDPKGEDGLTHIVKRKKGYYGYNDNFDFYAKDKNELKGKLKSWGYKLIAGKI